MGMMPSFSCCSNLFLIFYRMSFGWCVNESNIWTLYTQNPFVFALFYHFSRLFSMPFINYFLLLFLILPGFGVFPFKHYIGNLYKQGKVTLREASRLLKLNQIETMNLFLDAGIKGNLDASDVLASLERFVSK
jgi:hypothetical protein